MKHHPIQLKSIQIRKLYLEIFSKSLRDEENFNVDVQFKVGSKLPEFKEDVIVVNFICNIEKDKGFKIEVNLFGIFEIEGEFPRDKIEHWAHHNAPLILLPYVRENVASLCIRSDLNFHLPLIEVPTFRYEN